MKREWKETARRNIDRALIFQSNTHVATQNTHTHISEAHTNAMTPPLNSPFDEAIASDSEEEKHIVFVPGRLCLLGEHSDWVRS